MSAQEKPYVIPSITSLTGAAAFIGKADQDTLNRFETAINRTGGIHGRPIHFDFYDDQSNPAVAVQLFNQITATKVPVVLGPSLTNSCLAIMPFVKNGVVDYCMSPGVDPPKGSYVFSANTSAPDIFKAFLRYFRTRGWKRIATLTTSDATGQQSDDRIEKAVALPENDGLQVIAREHFAPSDLTVAAQIAKIRAANPGILIAWAIGEPFLTVLRGLSESGYQVPVAASNAGMTFGQMKAWGPYLPPQLYFSGAAYLAQIVPKPQAQALRLFYSVTKDVGVEPDFLTGLVWDPALIVVAALRKLGDNANAEQVHDFIEGLCGFPGIFGLYDFTNGDQRGLSQKDLMIMRWDAKQKRWVAVSGPGGAPR